MCSKSKVNEDVIFPNKPTPQPRPTRPTPQPMPTRPTPQPMPKPLPPNPQPKKPRILTD